MKPVHELAKFSFHYHIIYRLQAISPVGRTQKCKCKNVTHDCECGVGAVNDICRDRKPLVARVSENSYYWLAASKLVARTSRSAVFRVKRGRSQSTLRIPSQSSANQQSYRNISCKLA